MEHRYVLLIGDCTGITCASVRLVLAHLFREERENSVTRCLGGLVRSEAVKLFRVKVVSKTGTFIKSSCLRNAMQP